MLKKDFFIYRHAWRYNGAPDCEPELSDVQCRKLLKRGGWFVRNTFAFDCPKETNFWYLIKDTFNGLEEISKGNRKKLRHAFRSFDFRFVDNEFLKKEAYPIIKATFDDYRVTDRQMNEKVFNAYLDHCAERNYDYWGIFEKGTERLIGFCTVNVWENSCEYGITGVLPEYKHNSTYPYYGIYYKMNEYYLGEKHFKYVNDGSRSITEHSNIQPFLEQNFKFRKAYCKLKLTYKWWFGLIVKILYPFRAIIPNRSVKAVLMMHGMQTK